MSRAWRGRLYVLLPLLLLGIDLLVAPRVTVQDERPQPINAVRLLVERQLQLGAFRSHPIRVSIDSVSDSQYFASIVLAKQNALVVSGFVSAYDPGDEVTIDVGAFTSAVFQKLKRVAPEELKRFTKFINEKHASRPGDVVEFELGLDPSVRNLFPFDRLFVAVLGQGTGKENMDQQVFESIMTRIFKRAQQSDILNLVVPVIGYNHTDKNAVELRYFFRSFLGAVRPSSSPTTVWIDVYSEWPTVVLESIVASFNTALLQTPVDAETDSFNRQRVRGLYLMLTLCLLSTSFVIPLTWKSVAAIALAFIPVYFGLEAALAPFLIDLSGRSQLVITVGAYVALALLFPLVIRLKSTNLFKRKRAS